MFLEVILLLVIICMLNVISVQAINTIPYEKKFFSKLDSEDGKKKRMIEYFPIFFYLISIFKKEEKKINNNNLFFELSTIFVSQLMAFLHNYDIFSYNFALIIIIFQGLIILSFIDLEHFGIPDIINIPTLYLSLLFFSQKYSIMFALEKISIIIGASLILSYTLETILKRQVIGEGDLIVFGTMLGLLEEIKYVLLAIFVASFVALIVIIYKKVIKNEEYIKAQFVPYLTIGTLITYIYGQELIRFWIK